MINELTTYKTQDLEEILNSSGYMNDLQMIRYSKFVGINKNGDFLYDITYNDDDFQDQTAPLLVKFDHNLLTISAELGFYSYPEY
jgi:hypothetical protein